MFTFGDRWGGVVVKFRGGITGAVDTGGNDGGPVAE